MLYSSSFFFKIVNEIFFYRKWIPKKVNCPAFFANAAADEDEIQLKKIYNKISLQRASILYLYSYYIIHFINKKILYILKIGCLYNIIYLFMYNTKYYICLVPKIMDIKDIKAGTCVRHHLINLNLLLMI